MSDAPRRGPGLGDRWLAGDALPGVRFGLHDAVRLGDGRCGRVLLLARVEPAVEYVVEVDGGPVARVRQDEVEPAA